MSDYPGYAVGAFALLYGKLADAVIAVNATLPALVKSGPVRPVALLAGHPRSADPESLTLAAFFTTDDPPVSGGSREFVKTVRFRILLLAPEVGDDSPSAFEIARQVVSDAVTCRLDDADMLTPTVNAGAGAFASAPAMLAGRTGLSDIYPYTMPDGLTVCDGFSLEWFASFSLSRTG